MNYDDWNLPFIILIKILFKQVCNSIFYIIGQERCVEQQVAIRAEPSAHKNISYLKMHSVSCCFLADHNIPVTWSVAWHGYVMWYQYGGIRALEFSYF